MKKANYIVMSQLVREYLQHNPLPILEEIAPYGEMEGDEYVAHNIRRSDGELVSFRYNCKTTRWTMHADGRDGVGWGIIALNAFLSMVSQEASLLEVVRMIKENEVGTLELEACKPLKTILEDEMQLLGSLPHLRESYEQYNQNGGK